MKPPRRHGWAPSGIREMLHGPLYRGKVVWNRSQKVVRGGTKKQRKRDESEWLRFEAPELRIIPDELWQRVKARLGARTTPPGVPRVECELQDVQRKLDRLVDAWLAPPLTRSRTAWVPRRRGRPRADQLSGGQQQRVAIARALAQEASVVLADEPVASLDPESAATVLDTLRAVARTGVAMVASLHQVHLAVSYADRIIALRADASSRTRRPAGSTSARSSRPTRVPRRQERARER